MDLAEEGLEDLPRPRCSSSAAGRPSPPSRLPALSAGAGPAGPAASSDRLTGDWQPLGVRAPAAPFCSPWGAGRMRRGAGEGASELARAGAVRRDEGAERGQHTPELLGWRGAAAAFGRGGASWENHADPPRYLPESAGVRRAPGQQRTAEL